MTKHNFTQTQIFTNAWSKIQDNAWFLFTVYLGIIMLFQAFRGQLLMEYILFFIATIALATVSIKMVNGHAPKYEDLGDHLRHYETPTHMFVGMTAFAATFAVGLLSTFTTLGILARGSMPGVTVSSSGYSIVILGTAIILAMIYLMIRTMFFAWIVVDSERVTGIQAIKKSWKLTENVSLKLCLFFISVLALNILGALSVVGLIITIPLSVTAYTYVYKALSTE